MNTFPPPPEHLSQPEEPRPPAAAASVPLGDLASQQAVQPLENRGHLLEPKLIARPVAEPAPAVDGTPPGPVTVSHVQAAFRKFAAPPAAPEAAADDPAGSAEEPRASQDPGPAQPVHGEEAPAMPPTPGNSGGGAEPPNRGDGHEGAALPDPEPNPDSPEPGSDLFDMRALQPPSETTRTELDTALDSIGDVCHRSTTRYAAQTHVDPSGITLEVFLNDTQSPPFVTETLPDRTTLGISIMDKRQEVIYNNDRPPGEAGRALLDKLITKAANNLHETDPVGSEWLHRAYANLTEPLGPEQQASLKRLVDEAPDSVHVAQIDETTAYAKFNNGATLAADTAKYTNPLPGMLPPGRQLAHIKLTLADGTEYAYQRHHGAPTDHLLIRRLTEERIMPTIPDDAPYRIEDSHYGAAEELIEDSDEARAAFRRQQAVAADLAAARAQGATIPTEASLAEFTRVLRETLASGIIA